jgi:hypothetical protein
MAEQEKWKWQEPGTAWKGVGLYHVTLTIPERKPLLGLLDVPDNNPDKAKIRRTALGNALVDCLLSIPHYHHEIQVLHFCLMPDHLHAVLYVRHTMPTGIKSVVRGFWQAAKKLGRAGSVTSLISPNDIRKNLQEDNENLQEERKNLQEERKNLQEDNENLQEERINLQEDNENHQENIENRQESYNSQEANKNCQENTRRQSLQEETAQLEAISAGLREQMGDAAYYNLHPIFTEMPFIRPMGRNTQLPNTIRYIDMNPQRLATKRLRPGFFRVQRDIMIGGRSYDGVGNTTLLMADKFATVHVRNVMVKAAEQGNDEQLRNYKNSCVIAAREGAVMVSPFISTHEKQVMQVLLRERLPFVCLTDNGFRDYYKPTDALFDAVAAGRVLILSPWQYDEGKRHISRADCVALNDMAEEICKNA